MADQTTEVAGYVISDLIKSSFSGIATGAGDSFEKLSFDLRVGYEAYFKKLHDRFSVVKTLTHKNKPVLFKSVYVDGRVSNGQEELSNFGFLNALNSGGRYVVTGTGGIGKSMLMRYILLQSLEQSTFRRIPIFIELRTLSDEDRRSSIIEAIQSAVTLTKRKVPPDLAKHGLEKGAYLLILDGFDEIDTEYRQSYEKEIIKLSREYTDIVIVVSGRPDDRFSAWTDFHIYKVQPLNKSELKLLVQGLSVDDALKEKFCKAVEDSLWESHRDFLSNPLLATMMVMTFQDFAEIPEKVHVFYNQAFLTLYSMHDASKEYFTRESISGLSIDVFEKVFSTFCFLTYYENKISFDEIKILRYIEKALEFEKVTASNGDFLRELVESICIVQKDGLEYVFSHRSFQEYFAALFIYRNQSIDVRRALTRISGKGAEEKCISILYDMNPSLVDKLWALPVLSSMVSTTEQAPRSGSLLGYIEKTARRTLVLSTLVAALPSPRYSDFCSLPVLKKLYNEVPQDIGEEVFLVELPPTRIRDWFDEVAGRTATGRRRTMNRHDISGLLLKDTAVAEKWLGQLGIGTALASERSWIRATHKKVQRMVSDADNEFEDILSIRP